MAHCYKPFKNSISQFHAHALVKHNIVASSKFSAQQLQLSLEVCMTTIYTCTRYGRIEIEGEIRKISEFELSVVANIEQRLFIIESACMQSSTFVQYREMYTANRK